MRNFWLHRVCTAVLALAVVPAAPAYAQEGPDAAVGVDTERLAIAREIVERGFPVGTREALFFGTMDEMVVQMRSGMQRNMPDLDAGAEQILDDWMGEWIATSKGILRQHIPALVDGWAEGYATVFTTEELRDILAFVSTPSGQRFVEMSPKVMASPAFAEANQAYIAEVSAALPAAQAQLKERLEEYFDREAGETSDQS